MHEHGDDGDAADHGAAQGSGAIDEDGDEDAEHEDVDELGGRGEVGR